MEPAEGDGIDPEFVSLSQPRGENRLPWGISRHPLGAAPQIEPRATDSPSGLSPLGHLTASAGRPHGHKMGRGPVSRRHGPSDRDLCKDR